MPALMCFPFFFFHHGHVSCVVSPLCAPTGLGNFQHTVALSLSLVQSVLVPTMLSKCGVRKFPNADYVAASVT